MGSCYFIDLFQMTSLVGQSLLKNMSTKSGEGQ